MTYLRVRAPAKINLGLEILGRRDDGYHEIVTLAQPISLYDDVALTASDRLEVVTDPPVVGEDENLVAVAARAVAAHAGREPGGRFVVAKRVPLAAGLGGGSSDAAAAIRLLKRAWGLPQRGLMRVAASVGSDVPLFMRGGAVLVTGRGERVENALMRPRFWAALACPRFDVPDKTRRLYAALTPADWTDGRETVASVQDPFFWLDRTLHGRAFPNAFDRAADEVYPDFAALRRDLEARAAAPLNLTGAGPSLYALFGDRRAAEAAARRMAGAGVPTFVASGVHARPKIEIVDEPAGAG